MRMAVAALVVLGLVWASYVDATVRTVSNARVVRTLTRADGVHGGCMIQLNRSFANLGLTCKDRWVSFSCSGVFAPKDMAFRNFDSAELAMALKKRVAVTIDDTRQHNGYCFAYRIDVY